MPIRVNLKEIFPADSQEITVDKVNFNFNKLLELGVGDTGPQGVAGPQGAAGPTGLVGPQGQRGNEWIVDAVDPNTLSLTGLIDGDLYLNSNTFDVWQYDELTSTWSIVSNIGTVIDNYLIATGSPFVRGTLGTVSPLDTRFITFAKRGETYLDHVGDAIAGSLNTSNNDILFLNNFDEDVLLNEPSFTPTLDFPVNTDSLFNSLLAIYVDHTQPVIAPTSDQYGRYHIEIGSLYQDSENLPLESKLSATNQNLKIKFFKSDVSGSTSIPSTNYWINTAKFSLAPLESSGTGSIDQNARFDFVLPKYNNEDPLNIIKDEVNVSLGAAESLVELSGAPEIMADGIAISANYGIVTMGILENLEALLPLPYSAGDANFGFFNLSTGLDGFFFNDRLIQTGGNIEQIHTTPARYLTKELNGLSTDANINRYYSSIFSNGKYVITSFAGGVSLFGGTLTTNRGAILNIFQQESGLTLVAQSTANSQYNTLASSTADNHGHITDQIYTFFPTTGLTDVKMVGKYIYATRVMPVSTTPPVNFAEVQETFIIGEIDSNGTSLRTIGYLPFSSGLKTLMKVEIVGSIAYVLNKRETLSPWSETDSQLCAIDISDPTNPILLDAQGSPTTYGRQRDRYLDLAISGERAFISTCTDNSAGNATESIRIKRFDIHEPANLKYVPYYTFPGSVVNAGAIVVASGAVEKPAPIKIQGTQLFCGYDNDVYVYDITADNDSALALLNSFEVDPDIDITDIIINGDYLYVLGQNTSTTDGMLVTYNVSDVLNPFIIGIESRSEITAPGKMTLCGNKIYVATSQGTGGYSTVDGGVSTFEIDGFISPSANISSIKANTLKLSKDAYIGESLDVGNSINVGQGGIYIDKGQGLSTDGPIRATSSDPSINVSTTIVDVSVPSTVTVNADLVGFHFNFTGSVSSGTVYGIYAEGADENYLEGKTTINDVLSITPRASAPSTYAEGDIYYNSTNHKLYVRTNSGWDMLN